jgi:hypothetical protein
VDVCPGEPGGFRHGRPPRHLRRYCAV